MSVESDNPNRQFDPLAPVGWQTGRPGAPRDQGPPPEFQDAVNGPGQAESEGLLDALVERATRQPAELRLDWRRFEANLAAEADQLHIRPAAPKEVRPAPMRREHLAIRRPIRLTLYLAGGLAAMAAAVALTTVLVLQRGPTAGPGPGPNVAVIEQPGQGAAQPAAPGEVAWVGVDQAAARKIIDQPSTVATANEIVVIYAKRPGVQEPLANDEDNTGGDVLASAPAEPIVLTDSAPLEGTPYGGGTGEPEPDSIFFNFEESGL